jgi:transposase
MMEQETRRKRRKFTSEYKAETVRLIQRSGKSIGQMALELGIGETALRRWVEQAEVEAGRGPEGALKRSEREELQELRRENQRLRMEREILKKATVHSMGRCNIIQSKAYWSSGIDGSNGKTRFIRSTKGGVMGALEAGTVVQ